MRTGLGRLNLTIENKTIQQAKMLSAQEKLSLSKAVDAFLKDSIRRQTLHINQPISQVLVIKILLFDHQGNLDSNNLTTDVYVFNSYEVAKEWLLDNYRSSKLKFEKTSDGKVVAIKAFWNNSNRICEYITIQTKDIISKMGDSLEND